MLVFNLVFDLLWTGRGSSVTSLAFLAFRELNYLEKHVSRQMILHNKGRGTWGGGGG
jgi:hypothetical protein